MRTANGNAMYGPFMKEELQKLISFSETLKKMPQDEMESSAKLFFEKLTSLYQISLLCDALNDESKEWILPALAYLKEQYKPGGLQEVKPLSVEQVKGLIGWEF
jgi:acyl-CoA dehydrogenase